MVELEFFDEAKIALIQEVKKYWPEIMADLGAMDSRDWPDQLATIAAHCKIMLDGNYTVAQLDDLTKKLFWELRYLRGAEVISPAIGVPLSSAITHKDKKVH